jgi:hypothetical protein
MMAGEQTAADRSKGRVDQAVVAAEAEEGAPGEDAISYRLPALRPSTSFPRYGEAVKVVEGA